MTYLLEPHATKSGDARSVDSSTYPQHPRMACRTTAPNTREKWLSRLSMLLSNLHPAPKGLVTVEVRYRNGSPRSKHFVKDIESAVDIVKRLRDDAALFTITIDRDGQ